MWSTISSCVFFQIKFHSKRFEQTPNISLHFFFVLFHVCCMKPPVIFRTWPILSWNGSESMLSLQCSQRIPACHPPPRPPPCLPGCSGAPSAIWSALPVAYYPVDDSWLQSLLFSAIWYIVKNKQTPERKAHIWVLCQKQMVVMSVELLFWIVGPFKNIFLLFCSWREHEHVDTL